MKPSQSPIALNTLYQIERKLAGDEPPGIEVIGGTVEIYGSIKAPTTAPTGMFKTATGFIGIDTFASVPSYLYITGTATSIILTGIAAKPVV